MENHDPHEYDDHDHNHSRGDDPDEDHHEHDDHHHGHAHTHGIIDPSILTTEKGIWAVKWSFAGLFVTAIIQAADHVEGVVEIIDVKVRWLGHRLHAEVNISVDSSLSVENGHEIAKEFRHELFHNLRYLSDATIHVDPVNASGPDYHYITGHNHDGIPVHSH